MTTTDFAVTHHGSIMLLLPQTEEAVEWAEQNLPDDRQLFGRATVVEPRYIGDIINGILSEGLTV